MCLQEAKFQPKVKVKTAQKGHNQSWKAKNRLIETKGDKRAISSHVSLFFSDTRVGVARR